MLTSWTCESCDASNEMGGDEFCSECGAGQAHFSPIGAILDAQQLLFDGYIRTEIIGLF